MASLIGEDRLCVHVGFGTAGSSDPHENVRVRRLPVTLTAAVVAAGLVVSGPAAAATKVVIKGGGFGHGMGMSQYGAYGYAKHGVSASHIVNHYYRHSRITRKKDRPLRVGLLPLYGSAQSRLSLSSASPPFRSGGGKVVFRVPGRKTPVTKGNIGASFVLAASSTGGMRVYKNGTLVKHNGVSVFGVNKHQIVLTYQHYGSIVRAPAKDASYAYGRMSIEPYRSSSCSSGYCIRLIAIMPMQKYLYGLGEVPSSWPKAALKAQIIAARTYASWRVKSSQHRYPCDCAVYDSSVDQVYTGDAKRHQGYWSNWKGAVDATDREVIVHRGAPIEALYSSSSGGYTENNENVWGGAPVPYLRGVNDPYDGNAANPYHRWKVTMSWSHFASLVESAYNVGRLRKVKLRKPFGVSGRVTVPKKVSGTVRGGASIVGGAGTERVSGWSLHSVLGLRDTLFRLALRYTVGDNLLARYRDLKGAPGRPTGRTHPVPRGADHVLGRAQDFQHGRMTWRRKTDRTVWQRGVVLAKYDAMKREHSVLGMPVSDVWKRDGHRGARYVHGLIIWSTTHGARAVWGRFAPAYRHVGGVDGPLGVPTSGRHDGGNLPHGGRAQDFANGTVYLNPHVNVAYGLWGAIAAKYSQIGKASSPCGYPTAKQRRTSKGTRAIFQRGVIASRSGTVRVDC